MKSCSTCHATYPDSFKPCPHDGTAPKKTDSWAEGTVIRGKYRILNKIGQGEIAAGPFSGGVSYFSTEASDSPSFSRIFVPASPIALSTCQVIFDEPNVQAANGWSRWLQVDTLGRNFWINRSCTTADRAGHVNGVWVSCFDNQTGAPADTSFFLFVAR